MPKSVPESASGCTTKPASMRRTIAACTWYARSLWLIAWRDVYLRLVIAVLAVVFALPAVFALNTAVEAYSTDTYQDALDAMGGSIYVVEGGTVPGYVTSFMDERRRLIGAIMDAADDEQYSRAVAAYEEYTYQGLKEQGSLSSSGGIDLDQLLYSRTVLLNAIVDLDHPGLYQSNEAPLAYYLAFALCQVPYPLLFLPVAVAACACSRGRAGNRMLAAVPVGRPVQCLSYTAVIYGAVVLAAFGACLPGSAVALLHNGVGDFGYPVVYVASGQIVQTTVGLLMGRYCLLYLALSLLLATLLAFCAVFSTNLVCKVVFAAVVALPFAPLYFDGTIPGWLLPLLPTTYLDIPAIVGTPNYLCGLDISPAAGCTFRKGILCAFAWSAGVVALTVAALLVLAVRSRVARRRAGGGETPGPRCERPGCAALEPAEPGLAVEGATVRRGRAVLCADASLRVAPGDVVALVAPNGSGKTSFLQAVSGVGTGVALRLRGMRRADGIDASADPGAFRQLVYFAPDKGGALHPEMTVLDLLLAAKALWKSDRPLGQIAHMCGVDTFIGSRAGRLSQGMAQQASLAVACATGARYVLLDEPTNGLDQQNVDRFYRVLEYLAEQGTGVIVASHRFDDVERTCRTVYFLHDRGLVKADLSAEDGRCAAMYRELFGDKECAR